MRTYTARGRLFGTLAAVLLFWACGGDSDSASNSSGEGASCIEGQSPPCTCDDGKSGAARCTNGTLGPCECDSACGNGRVDDGEFCDGSDLGGETCASATMNASPTGTLRCTVNCTLDTSSCQNQSGGGGGGGGVGGGGGMTGIGGSSL